MTVSFQAEATRRLADGVDSWDVYERTIAQLLDARHMPSFVLRGSWAKGESSGPTVHAKDAHAARAELESLGEECTYSFVSLRSDDGTSATVYAWLDSNVVSVHVRGSQDARVEGVRAVAQRFLNSFPKSDLGPRIELDGVVLGAQHLEPSPPPGRARRFLKTLREHAVVIWLTTLGTVVGGVLLVLVLRYLDLE